MEIACTHKNMDFDSLAAQFGVTKLFPAARMVLGYPIVGNVRNFLALYRSSLPIVQMKYVELEKVSRIFLVDCQNIERVDNLVASLITDKTRPCPYTIFDHHHLDKNGLGPGAEADSVIEMVGAATTIVVEKICNRGIKLTPFEATMLLIGIYEDTGCLSYNGTTERDALATAFLLKHGADLTIVNDYLQTKMNDDQTRLLKELVKSVDSLEVGGARVILAQAEWPRFLDGLASLTRKLAEIESADAAFSVAHMKDRVHIVGRSDSRSIDVRHLVRQFGGDGHPGAGSAVVRNGNIDEIIDKLKHLLKTTETPETVASQIMTSPVRTVRPSTSMDEASRIMIRYGLDGLIVSEQDTVVGVVSRRDIDQATHHKLGHAPVLGFMSRPVVSIGSDTPLSEIQQVMVQEDIGRLPVLDEEQRLIGLVSRQEVLRTLYGDSRETVAGPAFLGSAPADMGSGDGGRVAAALVGTPLSRTKVRAVKGAEQPSLGEGLRIDLRRRMEKLDQPTLWLCQQLGIVAGRLNMVAYLVGGCVRDLLLGLANFDLDFVVEGSGVQVANALEAAYPGRLQVVARHERFHTARLDFFADCRREVDISTARTEFYEFPAALPTVEASGLQQDLQRRDFTINALAVCLNPGQFGVLVDHFGGLKDLQQKVIRILHPFSFIEDPTRIIRAARFATRVGFSLDDKTMIQGRRAMEMGIFDGLGGVRIKDELRLILESSQRVQALELLSRIGAKLRYLDVELTFDQSIRAAIKRSERLLAHYQVESPWTVYLGLLLSQLPRTRVPAVLDRLHLSNEQKEVIIRGLELEEQFGDINRKLPNSEVYRLFQGKVKDSLAIAAALASPGTPIRRLIKLYLEELAGVKPDISGTEIIKLGIKEGPRVGEVLNAVRAARLDGKVHNRQEEVDFVCQEFLSQDASKSV